MRRDDRHHILSLAGPPHTRGASTSPFSMSPHRGAWIVSFREDSTTSARWTTTTSAPNNPSMSSTTEIARCIILTSSRPSELTACTSPNVGHTYSFSDVMGHSQARVVERCGGYGVLNNEARIKAGAIVLALFQAMTGARLLEIVHFAPYGRSGTAFQACPGI